MIKDNNIKLYGKLQLLFNNLRTFSDEVIEGMVYIRTLFNSRRKTNGWTSVIYDNPLDQTCQKATETKEII
jgi:hypothetical protein